jgi:UDP:flavonoid glycosyltransferase YjiC (YdhE family)
LRKFPGGSVPMRVLMVTFDAGGNVPPFLEFGRELAKRGDDVYCMGQPSLRLRFDEVGVTLCPLEKGIGYDPLQQIPVTDQMGLFGSIMFDDGYGADLRREISRLHPDALVIDSYLFGAIAAAEASGTKYSILVHTLWDWMGLLGEIFLAPINEGRDRAGLQEQSATGIWASAHRILVTSSVPLDSPGPAELPNLRHTGPLFDERPDGVNGFEPGDDAGPLALVAFSTTYMEQEGLLQRVTTALKGMPLRATVTVGPAMDPASLPAADNVSVSQWLRHSTVIPKTARL